jgi:tricorn protease
MSEESDLRYHEWEYTRRKIVEESGARQVGYVHLRAMGSNT